MWPERSCWSAIAVLQVWGDEIKFLKPTDESWGLVSPVSLLGCWPRKYSSFLDNGDFINKFTCILYVWESDLNWSLILLKYFPSLICFILEIGELFWKSVKLRLEKSSLIFERRQTEVGENKAKAANIYMLLRLRRETRLKAYQERCILTKWDSFLFFVFSHFFHPLTPQIHTYMHTQTHTPCLTGSFLLIYLILAPFSLPSIFSASYFFLFLICRNSTDY